MAFCFPPVVNQRLAFEKPLAKLSRALSRRRSAQRRRRRGSDEVGNAARKVVPSLAFFFSKQRHRRAKRRAFSNGKRREGGRRSARPKDRPSAPALVPVSDHASASMTSLSAPSSGDQDVRGGGSGERKREEESSRACESNRRRRKTLPNAFFFFFALLSLSLSSASSHPKREAVPAALRPRRPAWRKRRRWCPWPRACAWPRRPSSLRCSGSAAASPCSLCAALRSTATLCACAAAEGLCQGGGLSAFRALADASGFGALWVRVARAEVSECQRRKKKVKERNPGRRRREEKKRITLGTSTATTTTPTDQSDSVRAPVEPPWRHPRPSPAWRLPATFECPRSRSLSRCGGSRGEEQQGHERGIQRCRRFQLMRFDLLLCDPLFSFSKNTQKKQGRSPRLLRPARRAHRGAAAVRLHAHCRGGK